MAIMSAHMGVICGSLVLQLLIVFRNRKTIHVSSECNHFAWTCVVLSSCTFDVNNEPSHGTILDLFRLNPDFQESIFQNFLCSKFLESMLWNCMQESPCLDHCFGIKTHLLEQSSVFFV